MWKLDPGLKINTVVRVGFLQGNSTFLTVLGSPTCDWHVEFINTSPTAKKGEDKKNIQLILLLFTGSNAS